MHQKNQNKTKQKNLNNSYKKQTKKGNKISDRVHEIYINHQLRSKLFLLHRPKKKPHSSGGLSAGTLQCGVLCLQLHNHPSLPENPPL